MPSSSRNNEYLKLQIKLLLLQSSGTEFQSFFEKLAKLLDSRFRKVPPYGALGDGGNDGYIPEEGIYYQIYAPLDPQEKQLASAKKMQKNFGEVMSNWSPIEKVNVFNFVFNDKYRGASIALRQAEADSKRNYSTVNFNLILADDIEQMILGLSDNALQELDFKLVFDDSSQFLLDHLAEVEIWLDRGNLKMVNKLMSLLSSHIDTVKNKDVCLEYGLLKARKLQREGDVHGAIEIYEELSSSYNEDPRALLYKAEIVLLDGDKEQNLSLLDRASRVDSEHWLLKLQQLFRKVRLEEEIDYIGVEEIEYENNRVKSNFLRLYAVAAYHAQDIETSLRYVNLAIDANPDRAHAHTLKLSIKTDELRRSQAPLQEKIVSAEVILKEIETVESLLGISNDSSKGLHLEMKYFRVSALLSAQRMREYLDVKDELLELALTTHFDNFTDQVILACIAFKKTEEQQMVSLTEYLISSKKKPSDRLLYTIFINYLEDKNLEEAKKFFGTIGRIDLVGIIDNILGENYKEAAESIVKDSIFALGVILNSKEYKQLRETILSMIPEDDEVIELEKLRLHIAIDDNDLDTALQILRQIDTSTMNKIELHEALDLAIKKEAWEFVTPIADMLIKYEDNTRGVVSLKLEKFNALMKLESGKELFSLGKSILENPDALQTMDDENIERLVMNTAVGLIQRSLYPDALIFIKEHQDKVASYEGRLGIAQIYTRNGEWGPALSEVVKAVTTKGGLNYEEYADLYFLFIEIGNLGGPQVTSEALVSEGTFVQFNEEDAWVYVGDDESLGIYKTGSRTKEMIGKSQGDVIDWGSKYQSEKQTKTIKTILTREKFILGQSIHHAHKLAMDGNWDKMKMIEVPATEEGIDPKFLIQILKDQESRGADFFEKYCNENIPFALLVQSEGSIPNALGRILNENRGFIHSSDGSQRELDSQMNVARSILKEGKTAYIDATAAMFLSERGYLKKVFEYFPDIKMPQSVVNYLIELSERFDLKPGQMGTMGLRGEQIHYSEAQPEKYAEIHQNLLDTVELFESKGASIANISQASKKNVFTEKEILPAMADAMILSIANNTAVITDDVILLNWHKVQTGEEVPEYCSSFALMKVLYEEGVIDFNDFINFFGYLSSYRLRFLPINIDDMMKAVYGDSALSTFTAQGLRKLNLPLVLSSEYGVPKAVSNRVMVGFVTRMLTDSLVLPSEISSIFDVLLEENPQVDSKKHYGNSLLGAVRVLLQRNNELVLDPQSTSQKFAELQSLVDSYPPDGIPLL